MINFELASNAINRQQCLFEISGAKEIIKEFLFDKCHYLTAVAAPLFNSQDIAIFYLNGSGRVIHSAVSINEEHVIDVIGYRSSIEIEAFYDAINSMTGIYQSEGRCTYLILKLRDFDPSKYYSEDSFDWQSIGTKIEKWFVDTGVITVQKEV